MTTQTITHDDGLYFSNVRLSEAERDAGLAAARAVFDAHGVTAIVCAVHVLMQADGRWHLPAHCAVWREAEAKAIEAATEGWAEVPERATLECEGAEVGQ